jgi:hypothetical protein
MALFERNKKSEVKIPKNAPGRVKNGFTLFHVLSFKTDSVDLDQNFLIAYDGKKAPGLSDLISCGHRGKLFMDSGAFVAQKKNVELDIDMYIDYANTVGDHLYAIAQMDYLPRRNDGGAVESTQISAKKTWENFLYMWDRIRPELRDRLIYIVHGEEDFVPLLRDACRWRDKDGNKIEYMGIGLAGGDVDSRVSAAKQVAVVLHAEGFEGKFHGFGIQTPEVLAVLPQATSSDSSTAIRDAAAGRIYLDGILVKAPSDTQLHHKTPLSRQYYNAVEPMFKERAELIGIDYDLALSDRYVLYKWNCKERSKHIEALVNKEQV